MQTNSRFDLHYKRHSVVVASRMIVRTLTKQVRVRVAQLLPFFAWVSYLNDA